MEPFQNILSSFSNRELLYTKCILEDMHKNGSDPVQLSPSEFHEFFQGISTKHLDLLIRRMKKEGITEWCISHIINLLKK